MPYVVLNFKNSFSRKLKHILLHNQKVTKPDCGVGPVLKASLQDYETAAQQSSADEGTGTKEVKSTGDTTQLVRSGAIVELAAHGFLKDNPSFCLFV